jgi:hypothetical protein
VQAASRFSGAGQSVGEDERVWRAARLLLVLGVAWRLLRYGLRFPLWGDEAAIVLNLMDSDNWLGVLRAGRAQVSPLLFLWAEKAALILSGASELALRLVPVTAGVLALILFARLARMVLEPLPAALAVGILSVSYFPVRFACEVKSYSLDLFVSVVFLFLAALWLENTRRLLPLALLVVAAPLGAGLSYPGILVLAAVSCVLLFDVWRHPDARAKLLFLAYNLEAAAVFVLACLAAGIGQFQGQGGFQNLYWQKAFPPWRPGALLVWLITTHTGNLFAYPLGDVDGMNTLTFLLCLAGIAVLRKSGRHGLLPLLLFPFAWTLLAAALRLYPYGKHPRVAQHLAAPICLLAGAGLAAALKFRSPSVAGTHRRAFIAGAVLACFALVGMVLDILTPYKSGGDAVFRRFVREIASEAGREDRVVFFKPAGNEAPSPLEFYLKRAGLKVWWTGKLDLQAQPAPRQIWIVSYTLHGPPEELKEQLTRARPPFVMVKDVYYPLSKGADRDPPVPCSVSRWTRSAAAAGAEK